MYQPRHVLGAGAVLLYGCAPRHPPDADTPRQAELEKSELNKPPPPPERAPPQTICWDFDYTRDEPPTQQTRCRVYSTMRLIRAGMLGQLASLQQWEEAMNRQDEL